MAWTWWHSVRRISCHLTNHVITKQIDGVTYMRLPYGKLRRNSIESSECATFWYRTGVENHILHGYFPEDFMRCPKCLVIQYGPEVNEWMGKSHYCIKCQYYCSDIGWPWLSVLFPKLNLYLAVNNHYYEA